MKKYILISTLSFMSVNMIQGAGYKDSQARALDEIAQQDPHEMLFDAAGGLDWRQMRFAKGKGAFSDTVVRNNLSSLERFFLGLTNKNRHNGEYTEDDAHGIGIIAHNATLNGEKGRLPVAFLAAQSGYLEAVQEAERSGASLHATSMWNDEEVGAFEGVQGSAPSLDGKQEIVDYLIARKVSLAPRTAHALVARGIRVPLR